MVITLVALVLLLVAVVAMLRTVDTSSIVAGNLAFRRDLTNRADTAIVNARTALVKGILSTEAMRINDLKTNATVFYSASQLQNGANGAPQILASDAAFKAMFTAFVPPTPVDGVTLVWVIDRQCAVSGQAYSPDTCESVPVTTSSSKFKTDWIVKPDGPMRPVYRISVRVRGPRSSEAYYQATYAD